MAGVEFVQDKESRAPFPAELRVAERVMDACLERGLIVFPGHGTVDGTAGDHLLLGPPLVITASELGDACDPGGGDRGRGAGDRRAVRGRRLGS